MIWRDVVGLCHLFIFVKRQDVFMKTDMMRDINTLRCEVKTTITKLRGVIT